MSNTEIEEVDSVLEHIQQLVRDRDDTGLYRMIEANACDENLILPWFGRDPIAYVAAYWNLEISLGKLIEKKADLSYRDEQGRCILFQTIYSMSHQTFHLLLAAGVEVNTCNKIGMTPLMVAARYSGQPFKGDFIRPLVEYGAHIESTDEKGNTALSHAISQGPGNLDIIHLLLELGAKPSMVDVAQAMKRNVYSALEPYFKSVEMLNAASGIPVTSSRRSVTRL